MRKKSYVKPDLICEEFTPEAYCASCKENGVTTYSASCDTSGYVFWDTNKNGEFNNGEDEYKNHNSAGISCSFTINYHPGEKNAFILADEDIDWYDLYLDSDGPFKSDGVLKDKYVNKVIHGYRIEVDGDSHFIANLNEKTFTPNLS